MKNWRLIWEPAPGSQSHQLGHKRRHLTFRTWEAAMAYSEKIRAQGVAGKPRIERIRIEEDGDRREPKAG